MIMYARTKQSDPRLSAQQFADGIDNELALFWSNPHVSKFSIRVMSGEQAGEFGPGVGGAHERLADQKGIDAAFPHARDIGWREDAGSVQNQNSHFGLGVECVD